MLTFGDGDEVRNAAAKRRWPCSRSSGSSSIICSGKDVIVDGTNCRRGDCRRQKSMCKVAIGSAWRGNSRIFAKGANRKRENISTKMAPTTPFAALRTPYTYHINFVYGLLNGLSATVWENTRPLPSSLPAVESALELNAWKSDTLVVYSVVEYFFFNPSLSTYQRRWSTIELSIAFTNASLRT